MMGWECNIRREDKVMTWDLAVAFRKIIQDTSRKVFKSMSHPTLSNKWGQDFLIIYKYRAHIILLTVIISPDISEIVIIL